MEQPLQLCWGTVWWLEALQCCFRIDKNFNQKENPVLEGAPKPNPPPPAIACCCCCCCGAPKFIGPPNAGAPPPKLKGAGIWAPPKPCVGPLGAKENCPFCWKPPPPKFSPSPSSA